MEGGETRGHRDRISVVRAAVKNLVLGDQIHHGFVGAECGKRKTATDGFGEADHVGLHTEVF